MKTKSSIFELCILHFTFCISSSSSFVLCILLFTLCIPLSLSGQARTGIIYPGASFHNQTNDTLFYLPKQTLETLMDWEEISSELIHSLRERNGASDSLIGLKTLEANSWYSKLIEVDKTLEESEVLIVKENNKSKRKNKIWFGVGVVAGLVIGVVL